MVTRCFLLNEKTKMPKTEMTTDFYGIKKLISQRPSQNNSQLHLLQHA